MLRIKQLIIISGLSCAGKTTLLGRIQKGEMQLLCEQLGIVDPLLWTYVDADNLPKLPQNFMGNLVVHYDIYTQYSKKNGFNYLPEIIRKSEKVVLLMLYTSPKILLKRNKLRFFEAFSSLFRTPKKYKLIIPRLHKLWKKHRVYRKYARVSALYDEWFDFCGACCAASHWMVDSTKENMVAQPFEKEKTNYIKELIR
jgi:hypothetical protein